MNNEEKVFQKSNINWFPGHMAKTKREISEKIDLIDIVYEVIDARIPKTSKNKDIDELIKNKPRILIMTKYDLCDKSITDKFIKYYENIGYIVIPVDLMSGLNVKKIFDEFKPDLVLGTGGYICASVMMAAKSLKIPYILHESNVFPGMAVKLCAKNAAKVLTGFEDTKKYLKL